MQGVFKTRDSLIGKTPMTFFLLWYIFLDLTVFIIFSRYSDKIKTKFFFLQIQYYLCILCSRYVRVHDPRYIFVVDSKSYNIILPLLPILYSYDLMCLYSIYEIYLWGGGVHSRGRCTVNLCMCNTVIIIG